MKDDSVGNVFFICGKTDEFVKRKSRCSNDHFFLSCTLKTTPISCGKTSCMPFS